MNIRGGRSASTSSQPALDLLAFAFMPPELARANLRFLLIENPNYFGSLSASSFKAVLHIEKDTTYECLSEVDFNPRLECIGATIQIRQPTGYSNGKHPGKSQEFVRFYLSVDDGENWLDQGVCTLNVSDKTDRTCAMHKVSLGLDPGDELLHFDGLPRLRAILSWNQIPPQDSPEWLPVWGNVLDLNPQTEATRIVPDFAVTGDSVSGRTAIERAMAFAEGVNCDQGLDVMDDSQDIAKVLCSVDSFSFGLLSPRKGQTAQDTEAIYSVGVDVGLRRRSREALFKRTAVWGSVDRTSSHTTSGHCIRAGN
ncbi:MAG: hypothetical protein KGN79_03710 [Acidobacteriota bacterium]|nr:hypothetical protein [Acidobacteriota bacterium]